MSGIRIQLPVADAQSNCHEFAVLSKQSSSNISGVFGVCTFQVFSLGVPFVSLHYPPHELQLCLHQELLVFQVYMNF